MTMGRPGPLQSPPSIPSRRITVCDMIHIYTHMRQMEKQGQRHTLGRASLVGYPSLCSAEVGHGVEVLWIDRKGGWAGWPRTACRPSCGVCMLFATVRNISPLSVLGALH